MNADKFSVIVIGPGSALSGFRPSIVGIRLDTNACADDETSSATTNVILRRTIGVTGAAMAPWPTCRGSGCTARPRCATGARANQAAYDRPTARLPSSELAAHSTAPTAHRRRLNTDDTSQSIAKLPLAVVR